MSRIATNALFWLYIAVLLAGTALNTWQASL
jgi:hypothetical protein